MKVLIIIDSLGAGGAEKSTAVLADSLKHNNILFEIICLYKQDIGVQYELQEKGYVIRFLQPAGFFAQVKEITEIISSGNFHLVHSILFNSNLRTRFAKRRLNFIHLESLVSTTYSLERFKDPRVNSIGLRIYKLLDEYTANRYVDHFHSITKTVKAHYEKHLGITADKITVIYRGRKGINQNSYQPVDKNKTVQLLNIGRNEFAKGQIFLLQAVKKLKELGYVFQLKIYGREGEITSELKEFIETNNLGDVVFLEGFINDVSKILLEADIFVFPSLYEGLGGALIEAQAAGLPIVCNDIPVFHEVVKKNVNAKFFQTRDLNSIIEAITFLIDNPQERLNYGKESLANFKSKFTEEENNIKMINLYKTLYNSNFS